MPISGMMEGFACATRAEGSISISDCIVALQESVGTSERQVHMYGVLHSNADPLTD